MNYTYTPEQAKEFIRQIDDFVDSNVGMKELAEINLELIQLPFEPSCNIKRQSIFASTTDHQLRELCELSWQTLIDDNDTMIEYGIDPNIFEFYIQRGHIDIFYGMHLTRERMSTLVDYCELDLRDYFIFDKPHQLIYVTTPGSLKHKDPGFVAVVARVNRDIHDELSDIISGYNIVKSVRKLLVSAVDTNGSVTIRDQLIQAITEYMSKDYTSDMIRFQEKLNVIKESGDKIIFCLDAMVQNFITTNNIAVVNEDEFIRIHNGEAHHPTPTPPTPPTPTVLIAPAPNHDSVGTWLKKLFMGERI